MFGFLKFITGSNRTKPPKEEEHKSSLPKKRSQIEKFNSRYHDVLTSKSEQADPFNPKEKTTKKNTSVRRQPRRRSISSFDELDLDLDPFN